MSKAEGNGVLKAIILGAGRSRTGGMQDDNLPACLLGDTFGSRVLDWILAAFAKVNIHNIVFVGGFRITEIAEKYRKLKYIYNPDWKNTGVIESLNKAKSELDSPLFISYGDIVFTPITCKRMIDEGSDITIAVDTNWRARGDLQENEVRKNMVVLEDGYLRDIGFLPISNKLNAEFIGLAFFGPKSLPLLNSFFNDQFPCYIGKAFEQSEDVRNAFLTDLLRYFIKNGVIIKAVDIGSEWAEMDSPRDLCRFVIGTKAQTLDRLSSVIKRGRFCRQYTFTISEWQDNRDKIINKIQDLFSPEIIVVRSSTLMEDSWQSSYAGEFRSVTGVDSTDRKETTRAISEVIDSYTKNGLDQNPRNQVLVQEMVHNVVISGVVLTRDLETGAPYYVINYDDESFKTDTVTSGSFNNLKTLLVNRASVSRVQNPRVSALLEVVQEIEIAAESTSLDIEFAISADECVYILQTRPLTCVSRGDIFSTSEEDDELKRIRDFLRHKFARVPFLYGDSTIFGDMPDWNPVEMIGSKPRPLAVSLYHYLITNSAWRIGRGRIGYFNPEPATLMSCIGGHPYIDVRCSFNNYLPASLSPELSEKLVNYYLRRLRSHPELHDKIEFDVMITCLDFDFENESKRFLEDGFSESEIREFRKGLFTLTDGVISGRIEPIPKLVQEIETLNLKKYDILNTCHDTSQIPTLIGHLLDDCVKCGTIPFAILARYGFIANSFLKSLVARGVFTPEDQQAFMHSIETVATELVIDINSVTGGRLSRDDFLKKYGHLRPGTYDITSYRYDEKPDLYFPPQPDGIEFVVKQRTDLERFEVDILKRKEIERLIAETGFTFTADQLLLFMHDAIKYREYGKFEFTKTVSDILVLLERFGKEYKYSRDSLSYLNIEQVRLWGINAYPFDYGNLLEAEIENGKRLFERSHTIRLPHLITCAEDIEIINIAASKPNFVTLKKVTGRVQYIDGNIDPSSVKGKIVLIEAADPGFDWIFANGIIGLVTKYGGAASHMTIRAAEFGIPAAIGCGEYLFEKLRSAVTITLDSGSQTIYVT